MKKLSPQYRQDPSHGIDPELREFLDDEYFSRLENRSVKNPKLLVVFACGNAVGKSVLARKLRDEFGGLLIENDAIKRTLLQRHPEWSATDKLHNTTWQYTMDLYGRLDTLTANGLVVRDGVITWYFDRILPIFERRGYEIFVVGYDLSEQKMRELIEVRGDSETATKDRLIEIIPDQQIHLGRFFEHHKADVMLDDESLFDHDKVASALRERIAQLHG